MKSNEELRKFGTRMKPNTGAAALALWIGAAMLAPGAIRYVNINSTNPAPPYLTWATAATNIQDVVDVAAAGDQILVTNGVYQTGGRNIRFDWARVVVDRPVVIQSVNGPQFTIIDAQRSGRCAVLTNGVTLSGFTLTNGFTLVTEVGGGGVAFSGYPSDAVVSNCVITRCLAHYGGAAGSASSVNVYPPVGGTLVNCIISSNSATGNPFFYFPLDAGGGVDSCRLINCTLIGNNASGPAQRKGGGAYASILQNCLLIGNSTGVGSTGGGAANSALINCTVVSNSASAGAGTYACWLTNCIVVDNSGTNHAADNFVAYTCTTPFPAGPGNITNAPLFVDAGTGNFRLQSNSPCINSGNNSYGNSAVDLLGWERIVDGTIDMGAYEWVAVPTHYVSFGSPNPAAPYLSWSTAATNIQDAVDAAVAGDEILVTNGVYQTGGRLVTGDGTTNRVAVDKPLAIRSVNGPKFTLIQGYQIPGTTIGPAAIRCVYLEDGATLTGFTLTNGATDFAGGGVAGTGAGMLGTPGNAGTLNNCVLIGNAGYYGGGAAGCNLNACVLTENKTPPSDGEGGGAYSCILNNCTLRRNSAAYGGGATLAQATNCLFTGNSALGGGGARDCGLNNCTLTGNSANYGGGILDAGAANCILYFNTATNQGANFFYNPGLSQSMGYCCTTPMPTNGIGNLTNAPLFVDTNGWANLRLQSNSPCINAGNNASVVGSSDLDGRPRIVNGTVDIGAHEFQPGISGEFIGWLSQYDLPSDGSADYADSDGDLLNNWQEWIAGTVPTDGASALRMFSPAKDASGMTVSWQSVSNRAYFLERSTNLASGSFFSVAGNVAGQAGTTTFIDTNAPGAEPRFYRVGVQR